MAIEKAKIADKIYDVVSFEEFSKNSDMYTNGFTAISEGDYVYPIRGKFDTVPGAYPTEPVVFFEDPKTDAERTMYSTSNIINFSGNSSLRELIDKQNKLLSAERSILTTIDNIFVPDIGENDTPEMKGLKQAIIDKKVDLDKYEPRFGPNYNNDKRLLRRDSITMGKLKSLMGVLDMKGTLIIEDASPNVPNPIGHKIVIELHSDDTEGDDTVEPV